MHVSELAEISQKVRLLRQHHRLFRTSISRVKPDPPPNISPSEARRSPEVELRYDDKLLHVCESGLKVSLARLISTVHQLIIQYCSQP